MKVDVQIKDKTLNKHFIDNPHIDFNFLQNEKSTTASDILVLEIDNYDKNATLENIQNNYKEILFILSKNNLFEYKHIIQEKEADFLVKPFESYELVLRLEKCLKSQMQDQLIYKNIVLYDDTQSVYIDKQLLILSQLEYSLLKYFIQNKKKLISKENLIKAIWDEDIENFKLDKLRVAVYRLKNKLKQFNADEYLQARSGFGYYLD